MYVYTLYNLLVPDTTQKVIIEAGTLVYLLTETEDNVILDVPGLTKLARAPKDSIVIFDEPIEVSDNA